MKPKRTRNWGRKGRAEGPGVGTFLFSAEEGGLRFGKRMKYRTTVSPQEFREAWLDWYGVRMSPRLAKEVGITQAVVRKAHLKFIKGFLRGLRGKMGASGVENPRTHGSRSLWTKLKDELGWILIPGPGLLDEAVELGMLRVANPLPPRSYDTMSEAIALSSPSGRVSKRVRETAQQRLSEELFGEGGLKRSLPPPEPERDRDLRRAKEFRNMAARGMSVRKFTREAEKLEQKWGVVNPRSRRHLSYRAYLASPEAQKILREKFPGADEVIRADYQRMLEGAKELRGLKSWMRQHPEEMENPRRKKRVDWIAKFNQVFKDQMQINYSHSLDQWYAQDWGGPPRPGSSYGTARLLINFPGEYEAQQRRAAEEWAEKQLSAGMPSLNPERRVRTYHLRKRVA